MKKFGTVLVSRQAGREAFLAFQPTLQTVPSSEEILLNFDEVFSLAPSWADEFLHPLRERFGSRVKIKESKNASVQATLAFLKKLSV